MVPFGMLGRGRLVSQEEAAVARQQRRWFRLKEGIETLWEKLHVSLEERSMFATHQSALISTLFILSDSWLPNQKQALFYFHIFMSAFYCHSH